jgi:hypothetical protein
MYKLQFHTENFTRFHLILIVRQKKGGMVGYNFVIAAFISLRVKSLFLEEKF